MAELEGDPKKFWNLVKSIVPGKKAKSGKISLVDGSGTGPTANMKGADTADFINTFFSNIGPSLAKNNKSQLKFYGEEVEDVCPLFSTNYGQVRKLCKEILTSGVIDIPTRVFRDAFLVIIPQLVYLFNLSFSTGIFPDSWKEATVILLYKGEIRQRWGTTGLYHSCQSQAN